MVKKGDSVTVRFPAEYKNWDLIIRFGEEFLTIHGFKPRVTPSIHVKDFIGEPELPESTMVNMIDFVLNMIKKEDLRINGRSSIEDLPEKISDN